MNPKKYQNIYEFLWPAVLLWIIVCLDLQSTQTESKSLFIHYLDNDSDVYALLTS